MEAVYSVLALAAFGYAVYWVYKRVVGKSDSSNSGTGKPGDPGQKRK